MKITNSDKGLQGIHTVKGVIYLRPSETKDVELSEVGEKQARRLPFLAFDGSASKIEPSERDDLKKQADELGIDHAKNIPTEKLKELVDAKLAE